MEGQWFKNKLNGFGRCIDKFGNCYIGYFKDGFRNHLGQFYSFNGDIFDGSWHMNERYGYGTFFFKSSLEAYIGFWKNGRIYTKDKKEFEKGSHDPEI